MHQKAFVGPDSPRRLRTLLDSVALRGRKRQRHNLPTPGKITQAPMNL